MTLKVLHLVQPTGFSHETYELALLPKCQETMEYGDFLPASFFVCISLLFFRFLCHDLQTLWSLNRHQPRSETSCLLRRLGWLHLSRMSFRRTCASTTLSHSDVAFSSICDSLGTTVTLSTLWNVLMHAICLGERPDQAFSCSRLILPFTANRQSRCLL